MTLLRSSVLFWSVTLSIFLSGCSIGSGLGTGAKSGATKGGTSGAPGSATDTGTAGGGQSAPVEGSSASGAEAAAVTVRFSISSGAVTYATTAALDFPDANEKSGNWDVCIAQNDDCSECTVEPLQGTISKSGLSQGEVNFSALYVKKSSGERTACVAASTQVYPLVVEALYSAAPQWNDYVKTSSVGTECAGTEDLYSDCIHGGDRRVVTTYETSCDSLTLVDSAAAFDWTCEVSEGHARFLSTLKEGKGLTDLVEASAWKALSVTLTTAQTSGNSTPTAWWTNPVTPLPDNSATIPPASVALLESSGTIYTLSASRATAGYNINADKIGLVTLGDAVLSEVGTEPNHDMSSDEVVASPNAQSIIASGSQKFVWIEGSFRRDSAPALRAGIAIKSGKFFQIRNSGFQNMASGINHDGGSSRFENVSMDTGSTLAIASNSAQGNLFRGIRIPEGTLGIMGSFHLVQDVQVGRIALSYANDNRIQDFHLHGSPTGRGIDIQNISHRNLFEKGRITYQASSAVYVGAGCSSNRFSKMTVSNSNHYAFEIVGSSGNQVENTLLSEVLITSSKYGIGASETRNLHVVASSILLIGGATGGSPFITESDRGTILHNVLMAGNKSDAIALWNSEDPTLSQMYIDSGGDYSISLYGTTHDVKLAGNLAGPGPSCGVATTVVNPGFSSLPGATCTPPSGAEYVLAPVTATLRGKLSGQDSENPDDDSALSVSYGAITDFSSFESRFRSWGMAETFGDDASTGICVGASTCAIWDFGLSSSDTALFSRSDAPGGEVNTPLSAGSKCPSSMLANKTLTSAGGSVYLKLAFEEVGDQVGDDDGLCEANEACVYSPSIGVDQGEDQFDGATFETCSMGEGPALAGITLRAYQ